MIKKENLERWTVENSMELYGIRNWGAGYFNISENGEVVITPMGSNKGTVISIPEVINGLKARGMGMPVLLRLGNILDSQITYLHETFRAAISKFDYKGSFRGVYPIKVNQQQQVLEELTMFGSKYHHGLEAGSKAELLAAISMIKDLESCIICNGYKDEEFVDLGLYARKMGMQCFFVLEMPSELPLILERAEKLNVKPLIGVRIKLSSRAGGHWTDSGGDRSVFGLSTSEMAALQTSTFYGKEKKSLAYIIGIMNMILHGIDAPNILHTNTLNENLFDVQESQRYQVVLANPPFGGKERGEVQQNFPIKTGETAFLFLQHFIKMLKAGGRAGIVIKNTFLSNTDNASVALRKTLLETCNLHTVLDMPGGTFLGAGVKTVVLFFEKGTPTQRTWFYQLNPGRNLGKTNPLNEADLAEFVRLQKTFAPSANSWSVETANVNPQTWDLGVKNPNQKEAAPLRSPKEILAEIRALDEESARLLSEIEALL